MKISNSLPFILLYSALNFFKPNFAEAQAISSASDDQGLYHISGAQFMETDRDTTVYGKNFVGLVQVGSKYVVWRAEVTRDKSTTAASFYNVVYGPDRSKDEVIKQAMALTNDDKPENIEITRDEKGYIVDIKGTKWTVNHTKKSGQIHKHALLRRNNLFWAPADALKTYKSLTPQNVKNLENKVGDLDTELKGLKQSSALELLSQKQKVVDVENKKRELEERLRQYDYDKQFAGKGNELPIGVGLFMGVQTNTYNFEVSSRRGNHKVKKFNVAGGGGIRLFANTTSKVRPQISASIVAGTDFDSQIYSHKISEGKIVDNAVRIFSPTFSFELLGGVSYDLSDNLRLRLFAGAIKNLPGEEPVQDGVPGNKLPDESLDIKLRDWVPTLSIGTEFPVEMGALSFLIGSDFGNSPMRRPAYAKFQWEINTGSFFPEQK